MKTVYLTRILTQKMQIQMPDCYEEDEAIDKAWDYSEMDSYKWVDGNVDWRNSEISE